MLNLLTGGPGSGKTCFMIGELIKAEKQDRRIFNHGIPELTIPHIRIKCTSKACTVCADVVDDDSVLLAENWHQYVERGDLVIMDEVQHIFRPRGAKAVGVPDSLALLETARHGGFDFWFMTQHPSFVDVHIRRLVTRHIHIRYSAVGDFRMMYEWPEVNNDPTQTWLPLTVKNTYSLNKDHYPYYKSADVHIKQERKKPKMLYVWSSLVLFIPLFIWLGVSSFNDIGTSVDPEAANVVEPVSVQTERVVNSSQPRTGGIFGASADVDIFDREPVHKYQPESAPAYSQIVRVTDYPRLSGCMMHSGNFSSCKCYTQQGTRVEVDIPYCVAFINNPPFNPYNASGARVVGSGSSQSN